jgi:hypothetical protein
MEAFHIAPRAIMTESAPVAAFARATSAYEKQSPLS